MTTPTPRWTAADVNRIAMTDALHQRDVKPGGVFCRCQRWDRKVPYNATAVAVSHQQHRTDELLSAFAAVLRDMPRDAEEASPFQSIADAIADVSYAGKQVTRGHGRYLADAALHALVVLLDRREHPRG